MKIIVFSPTSTRLTPTSIKDRPLGGADQALLRMIFALAEVHEVTAYIPTAKESKIKNLIFRPFQDLFNIKEDCDLLIHYRKCYAIPNTVTAKAKVFYSQDDTDSPCFAGIPETYFDLYDGLIVLSKYHKEQIKKAFKINEDKIMIIGNGADQREEVNKDPINFVYASTPFRGLVVLAKMWKQIIEWFPKAELHIFSSMVIYDGQIHDELYFNQLYAKLKRIKGIVYHGSVTQEEVLQYLDRATMLLYPNTFPETYCNVIMEARSSRTPFITSDKGSLKETGGLAGMYVKGNPYSEEYQKDFLNKVHSAIKYPKLLETMKSKCYPIRTWEDHAFDFQTLMIEKFGKGVYNEKD